jgi:hypothetical protein
MSIANAVQRGSYVYAYDEKGFQLCMIPAGDGLMGYTSSTVNIKQNGYVYSYDEKGYRIGASPNS